VIFYKKIKNTAMRPPQGRWIIPHRDIGYPDPKIGFIKSVSTQGASYIARRRKK